MGEKSTTSWAFHGEVTLTLDAKGRVTVPSRWRFEGLTTLLALPDEDLPVLKLMPSRVFHEMLEKMESDPTLTEAERLKKIRYYSPRAFDCPLDAQGRLLLPSKYVEKLELSKEVTLIGAYRHIEIWQPTAWKSQSEQLEAAHDAGLLRLNR